MVCRDSSSANATASDNDMRFKLTESEREAVVALKEACDRENVAYHSIFDLAKYVLVSHSAAKDSDPKAQEKRLKFALKRMKKRQKWEAKYRIQSVDVQTAFEIINNAAPGFYVNHYTTDRDGRVVVGHHHCFTPDEFIYESEENLAMYFASEQWRYQLAAADMEEARRGVAVVGITDGKHNMSTGVRYVRLLKKGREILNEAHAHRVRGIYSELPPVGKHVATPIKKLLPAKIAGRVKLVSGVSELENRYIATLPKDQHNLSVIEWAKKRSEIYQETLQRLTL